MRKTKRTVVVAAVLALAIAGRVSAIAPLASEREASVDVGNGRQLFVDDYAIESTNRVRRSWNAPTKVDGPVIRPTTDDGSRVGGCTVATDGGLWWDPAIGKFRLWYEDDWCGHLRYAESSDGFSWEYPDLGKVKGTNRVFSDAEETLGKSVDSWSVWPDYRAKNPYARWTMLVSAPGGQTSDTFYESADGRVFNKLGVAGFSGDRTTMHFDSILNGWVMSLRDYWKGRCRRFFFLEDFALPARQYAMDARHLDGSRVEAKKWVELPSGNLYDFDAVPYESLMLGVKETLAPIHITTEDGRRLADNDASEHLGLPKCTRLEFCFSRDGKRYDAGDGRCAILPSGLGSGKWDTGYLSAVGGICVIMDEKLWFYYSGLRGDGERRKDVVGDVPMYKRGMYYNGAIGVATLRRDGFCGMVADGKGELTTKPLAFTGSHLFVNAECLFGEVAAEVIDADGKPFPGFAFADCKGLKYVDRTKAELLFAGGSLSSLAEKSPRIRFGLHCATLYSFWISPSKRGESRGYVAAGGPAYRGLRDL